VGLTFLWVWMSPSEYRATSVLRLADARRAMTRGVEQTSVEPQRSTEQLLSQIQMLRSRWVASGVVDSTGLRLEPNYRGFKPSLLQNVRVEPDAPADTLNLEFRDADYAARNRAGATETAAYGSPLTLPGITFTVESRPRARDRKS